MMTTTKNRLATQDDWQGDHGLYEILTGPYRLTVFDESPEQGKFRWILEEKRRDGFYHTVQDSGPRRTMTLDNAKYQVIYALNQRLKL